MDERERKYPSNSYSKVAPRKGDSPPEKKVEKVATGHVTQRKKSLGEKFAETFLAADMQSVSRHIVFDVLIPEIKNMLSDMIHGSTNMMLFGDRRGNRMDRDRGVSYVRTDYGSRFNRGGRTDERDREAPRPQARNIVDDIVFDTRLEGEEVLDNMIGLIKQYNVVSVKDLYGFAGIPSNYTHDKWGWFDLSEATVDRVSTGYLLKLPKPQVIDQ